jgi:hypothetical protein
LFLDSNSLREETRNYLDYLHNTVGLNVINEDQFFVFLDTNIKTDRIYEYYVRGCRVPQSPDQVEYGFILESQGLTTIRTVGKSSTNTLFDFSKSVLGSPDLAWTLALVNPTVMFFGVDAYTDKLIQTNLPKNTAGQQTIIVVSDYSIFLKMINDSISLFTLKDTFVQLLRFLGGMDDAFINAFVVPAIDITHKTFSCDSFRSAILKDYPNFNPFLKQAGSSTGAPTRAGTIVPSKGEEVLTPGIHPVANSPIKPEQEKLLSSLPALVLPNTGNIAFTSIEDITTILKFINGFYIAVTYYVENTDIVEEIIKTTNPVVEHVVAKVPAAETVVKNTVENAEEKLLAALKKIL